MDAYREVNTAKNRTYYLFGKATYWYERFLKCATTRAQI